MKEISFKTIHWWNLSSCSSRFDSMSFTKFIHVYVAKIHPILSLNSLYFMSIWIWWLFIFICDDEEKYFPWFSFDIKQQKSKTNEVNEIVFKQFKSHKSTNQKRTSTEDSQMNEIGEKWRQWTEKEYKRKKKDKITWQVIIHSTFFFFDNSFLFCFLDDYFQLIQIEISFWYSSCSLFDCIFSKMYC